MRSWVDEWGETWLSRPETIQRIDGWVRERLVSHHQKAHRAAAHDSVSPWSIDALVADVDRFAQSTDWLWATTSICLLQELLFCADDGGIRASRSVPNSILDEVTTLRLLRNALFHPANIAPTSSKDVDPALEQLSFRMDRDPEFANFAADLMGNWSFLASRPVTVFALRRLNSAGREYARQLGWSVPARRRSKI